MAESLGANKQNTSPKWRILLAPLVGVGALLGGVGYTASAYNRVNVPTVSSTGEETGILDAAMQYLGPEGNEARCSDANLTGISGKVEAIPDSKADELLSSGALQAQADQFNSLGANGVTAEDLHALLTTRVQNPDTQCGRPDGTSTAELIAEAPKGLAATVLGVATLAFYMGTKRRSRVKDLEA